MTSKHNLEFILKEFTRHLSKLETEIILDRAESIVKDLDILETLKPHLINAGIGTYDNVNDYEILHLKLTLSGEEYNKIKEWLNDIHW